MNLKPRIKNLERKVKEMNMKEGEKDFLGDYILKVVNSPDDILTEGEKAVKREIGKLESAEDLTEIREKRDLLSEEFKEGWLEVLKKSQTGTFEEHRDKQSMEKANEELIKNVKEAKNLKKKV